MKGTALALFPMLNVSTSVEEFVTDEMKPTMPLIVIESPTQVPSVLNDPLTAVTVVPDVVTVPVVWMLE